MTPPLSLEPTDTSPPRGRPTAKSQHLIRGRLLDAAWQVLIAEGMEGFSIDKVVREARASKATLYARFTGRSDILRATLEHELERSLLIFPRYARDCDLVELLKSQCIAIMRQLASDEGRTLERLIDWAESEGHEPAVRPAISVRAQANVERFLAEAAADGKLCPAPIASRLWFEGLIGHAKLLRAARIIDWDAEQNWAEAFVRYHFAAADYDFGT